MEVLPVQNPAQRATSDGSIMLRTDRVFKSYRRGGEQHTVLKGMSFSVRRGECYGLLGPNGAGKTTTLRACLGLIVPDSGTIELVGYTVPQQARNARKRIGVVPQSDSLDPDFTVEENLLVFGRYFGMSDQAIRQRIPYLLDFSGLTAKRAAYIGELSGGMRRRLTLARALVNDPDLIFMDEPTTGLDPQARHMIWERLKSLLAAGKTILLTTHFMDEAERLCDRLAVIDDGRVVTQGDPRTLIHEHIEPDVIEVYGDGAREWVESHAAQFAGQPRSGATRSDATRSDSTRVEQSGETWFIYTTAGDELVASLKATPQLRYLYRPANLEDLFLKLTGRGMRD